MRAIVVAQMLALAMTASPISAHENAPPARAPAVLRGQAEGAEATVDTFHAALHRGDAKAAAALLAEDALIFESGGVERSKAEYVASHLPADVEFSRAVSFAVAQRKAHSSAALAWVASEGRATGRYKGKPVDQRTTETMILRKMGGTWRIVHIHWSSAKSRG